MRHFGSGFYIIHVCTGLLIRSQIAREPPHSTTRTPNRGVPSGRRESFPPPICLDTQKQEGEHKNGKEEEEEMGEGEEGKKEKRKRQRKERNYMQILNRSKLIRF